jgi:hypothetical protein
MFFGVELDARLFFVKAGGAISQGARSGVLPQRLERLLQLLKAHIGPQRHLAVHMDFKGSVVT